MIAYVRSSLFVSPARTLVNTVNTAGVMGKGIAKVFRDVYPAMFEEYRRRCERKEIGPGVLQLFPTPHKTILNFPTKRHWRQPSRLDDVEAGLRTFVASYAEHGLTSVAFPQLGCGNGGLDWETQVQPLMERYLASLPIDIYIHVPSSSGATDRLLGLEHAQIACRLQHEPANVPFAVFCHDLARAVASAHSAGWRVASSDAVDGGGLVLDTNNEAIVLPLHEIREMWRRLTGFGLLSAADFRPEHRGSVDALIALLTELPYLERAAWAMEWRDIDSVVSNGLLYLPPSAPVVDGVLPRQAELFAASAVA